MKIVSTHIAFLLIACCAFTQNFQPFLPGKLHYFTSSPNYSVRVDSAGLIGGDSAFWMNPISVAPTVTCAANEHTHFLPDQEGFFADHFIHRADGAFQFVNRGGDTATFHTLPPNGVAWNFLSDSSLTAVITSRGLTSVSGNPDSVIVIDVSDGHQYQLTQHYGLYSGPNLSYYLRSDLLRSSTLAERPTVPDFKDFFDWQPGDNYSTYETYNNLWDTYERYEFQGRSVSANGDTLTLTAKHRYAKYYNPSPIDIHVPDTVIFVLVRQKLRFLELATYEPDTNANGYHRQVSWSYNGSYFNRRTLNFQYFKWPGIVDSCGYGYPMLAGVCVDPMPKRFTLGLGETYRETDIGQTITTCMYEPHTMVCYEQAGKDSLGPCPPRLILLDRANPTASMATLSLVRNSSNGALQLHWKGMALDTYKWQMSDLSGRILSETTLEMQIEGSASIDRPGSAGVYLLRISNVAGTWSQTLRIPVFGD